MDTQAENGEVEERWPPIRIIRTQCPTCAEQGEPDVPAKMLHTMSSPHGEYRMRCKCQKGHLFDVGFRIT